MLNHECVDTSLISSFVMNSDNPMARKCRALRERLNLTQQEMAEKFRISLRTWQNWEAGINEPPGPVTILMEQLEVEGIQTSMADKCRQLRKFLGVTKAEMARRFNVQPNTWGYWEVGKQKPSIEARKKIDEMLEQIQDEPFNGKAHSK